MSAILMTIVAVPALLADAPSCAQEKRAPRCKKGYKYNKKQGKCKKNAGVSSAVAQPGMAFVVALGLLALVQL